MRFGKDEIYFEQLEISLDDHVTLFVGKNGAGKSTILDAIAIAVSTFLCGIEGGGISRNIQREDARYLFFDMEGVVDAQHQFPVEITGKGQCNGKMGIEWTRSLNSNSGKTTVKDAKQLIEVAEGMQNQVMAGDTQVVFPILSYYGTGRLYAQKKEKRDLKTLQRFNRQVGYLDCMAAESNEKMMLNWFEKMTLKSLQMQQRDGIIGGISQLRTVEAAVCACFRRISKAEQASLSFDLDTHRIMVEYTDAAKEKCRFALNEMSDGYKNTLSMIDEIDLHLHPEWQQTILQDLQSIFPKVQFLVTSHAPAVINSVKREHVRILDGGCIDQENPSLIE